MRKLMVILALILLSVPAFGITGTVVDNKGKPVAGAKIAVWTFWTFDRTFHTDSNGEFVYLKASNWDGTVSVQTFRILDAGGKPVPKATVTMPWYNQVPLTLYADKRGQFSYPFPADTKGKMRILDRNAVPIPHARAVASGGFSSDAEITTDEKGEYKYPALQNMEKSKRELRFHASVPGYAYGGAYFTEGQAKALIIKLWPEQLLKAWIVDEDGMPIRGASVCLDDLHARVRSVADFDSAGYDIMPVPLLSSKDGSVSLHHLPSTALAKSADVRLTIFGSGRCQIERVFDLAELRKSPKIVLPRMCALRGVIKAPVPGPLPDSLTLVMKLQEKYGPSAPSEHYATIDKSGKFEFKKLPPGTAMIRLLAPRRQDLGWVLPAVRDVAISSRKTETLDLVGTTGALISGSVRDKATGNAISTAMLNLQDAANPDGEALMADGIITDKDGKFSARVAAGKVSVRLQLYFLGDTTVRYKRKDQPVISIEAADGENRPGLDFLVSPPPGQSQKPPDPSPS